MYGSARKTEEKKQSKEAELNSAHHCSQAKFQLVQTSYIKPIKLFLFAPYNKNLTNWAWSVCMGKSWPRLCVQTSLRTICTHDLSQNSPIQTSCSVSKS